jgi:hypothetical protein
MTYLVPLKELDTEYLEALLEEAGESITPAVAKKIEQILHERKCAKPVVKEQDEEVNDE